MCVIKKYSVRNRDVKLDAREEMTDMSLDELLEEDDDDFDRGRIPSLNTVGSDVFDELFDDDEEYKRKLSAETLIFDNSTVIGVAGLQ